MTALAVGVTVLYAAFVEWIWGWGSILAAWEHVGLGRISVALVLLVATYFVRTHRMHDYFPRETAGQFLRLYRLTQIHNLLNIMLPLRTGETSFPLLMRSEFGVPLAHGTAALLVLRLLDLHALLAAAGVGLVIAAPSKLWASLLWLAFLAAPLVLFPLRTIAFDTVRRKVPARLGRITTQIADGVPGDVAAFVRAWLLTVVNWGVKVAVLAWILRLLGVDPVAAAFGGALGGELSSVLPIHAPGGVGTYPAGIVAGATVFGAHADASPFSALTTASINTHLLMLVSALAGTGLSVLLPVGSKASAGRDKAKP